MSSRRVGHRRPAAWLCAALATVLLAPAAALADGDPASDVLASQALYLPGDGGFAPSQTARLSALLAEAQRAGVPTRQLALPHAAAPPGSGSALGSVDLGSWLALAAGAALIALAWTASLRARPLARLRQAR